MRIGIPKEIFEGEKRVATVPEVAKKLIQLGFTVTIETGAGSYSNFSDEDYKAAGCSIATDAPTLYKNSDLILKVRCPNEVELKLINNNSNLISFIWPAQNKNLLEQMTEKKLTALSMDCVPRISRAQKLDALSSMANIAGYRAVIEAAHQFGRFFTGQVTAAGKIPPAKVFVIGAGVAGLSAIGSASGLGAIVRATDTRSEVKDQVKSMGGEFIEVNYKEEGSGSGGYAKTMSEGFQKAQKELTHQQCKDCDIIITTALIPGKPAPKLITKEMVADMKSGSVIVDLASEQGGNCELTHPGELYTTANGVTIIGFKDLPSRLSRQSSILYSTNILRLIEELCTQKNGSLNFNMNDDVIRGTTVTHQGQITWPPPAIIQPSPQTATKPNQHQQIESVKLSSKVESPSLTKTFLFWGSMVLFFIILGLYAPAPLMGHLTVFALSCFVGYMVVWNVTASLHTPLMSVTNAISSIIILGSLTQISSSNSIVILMSAIAIVLTAINMFGGFYVTHRMLKMFRK